ncbi:sodium/potassium-transporting ATPase subunit beta-2-like [Epargyreus clarus]|uniref:sodium/potassium-transporting ATPase subunit beta-2-like n=1 Tax=Epargyreus clarus TaxID=520877 RepID=UPI003C30DD1F
MGLEKRTIKIIVIVAVILVVIGTILGLLLGLLLPIRYVELEVWPRSDEYNSEEPLIYFRANDPGSWHPWYKKINDFLRVYETSVPEEPPRAPCSVNRQDQRLPVPQCEQALAMWAPCNADHFYGYADGRPCVFLRLSHIHYWVPEPYNVTLQLPLPDDMPHNIKEAMRQRPAHQFGDFIWVSCDGEFSSDKENVGTIQYIPIGFPPGFPASRLHTADRLTYSARSLPDDVPGPLIGVFFENPKRGLVINVECRIWTRDIYYNPTSRTGRARFELHVE